MDIYTLQNDLHVFGARVALFPQGIGEAFNAIMQKLPCVKDRSYYGLSNLDTDGKVVYYATTEEKSTIEAEKYGYKRYTLQKGNYLTVTVHDWQAKTDSIKDIFHEMMQDKRADNTKFCIEWYKHDNEMMCMLQTDPVKELFAAIDEAAAELMGLILPLSEMQINTIPFKDSWTAAQLATHITKSNNGIVQAMEMEGKLAERAPDERAGELKKIFLDFNTKMKSPEFIVPKPGLYEKEKVAAALKKSSNQLEEKRGLVNLSAIIEFPAFDQLTKLELLHFVLYHTQRHIHQLKNILKYI